MTELILSIVSIAATWLLARWYYRKQAEDLQEEHNRLYDRLSQALRVEDARQLSLDELEDVILERGYPTQFGIVPAECPDCGADTATRGGVQTGPHGDEYPWMEVSCTNPICGWSRQM